MPKSSQPTPDGTGWRNTRSGPAAMPLEELAGRVNDVARLEGSFVLRSGQTATDYFDKYQFEARPDLLAAIATALEPLIPPNTEMLAGLELGGVPVATALSLRTGLPAVFVRKAAKDYGTAKLAEGPEIDGRRLLVVEDVVTSGGQVIVSTADLRALGAVVDQALCVIDRQQGGADALAAQDVTLTSLLTRTDLDAT